MIFNKPRTQPVASCEVTAGVRCCEFRCERRETWTKVMAVLLSGDLDVLFSLQLKN